MSWSATGPFSPAPAKVLSDEHVLDPKASTPSTTITYSGNVIPAEGAVAQQRAGPNQSWVIVTTYPACTHRCDCGQPCCRHKELLHAGTHEPLRGIGW